MEELLDLDVFDLTPSSNLQSIDKIFSKNSSETWQPAAGDNEPTIEIDLPDVNGKRPGEYDIMSVTFKQTGEPVPVTVTIKDGEGKTVLEVSPESPCDFT